MNNIKIGKYKGMIFDLDGVLVTTDNCHYLAWKKLAGEENIYFDRSINEQLRGVSRMESLNIVLKNASKEYTAEEKNEMATRKNSYYVELVKDIDKSAIIEGAEEFVKKIKKLGLKIAIGSSSKNASLILEQTKMKHLFDAIVDGNDIRNSKPNPEVFLKAAQKLGFLANECLVAEDADAGVEAAISAGMDVIAVGYAKANKRATYCAASLKEVL